MTHIILFTGLLYLVQLILPMPLTKRSGEAAGERAKKAVHNLRESLPVFFTFALLSMHLEVEANVLVASIWLALRIIFVLLYITGLHTKPVNEAGYVAQPIRSLAWFGSIVCLIMMGINLI
ncbi:MAPEG family protein [Gammaproteobacteria bacterium]|nr:MAPEG family protein [Gammaproteobacteria bacterium]MDA9365005.1 MAPEG family protein [Gammaproteobacteria bacterium]MDA9370840.1 MAPEG family protein [Gammaproteobacteria bacterium]MDA9973616.1 MAPEG family protein [Gammaproteobacteria bacterium]MDC1300796.1 MAPEG family protein [Gammaproteobacteria bacterium]